MPSLNIQDAFKNATSPTSHGGKTVTKAELQAIVRATDKSEDALSDVATQLAAADATTSAKREYARLAQKYGFASLADRLSTAGTSGSSSGSVGGGSVGVGGGSSGSVGGGS